ncbi:MAG: hypothetical protein L0H59_05205 [Tomitella sp.]|nr:hypothetical protein [Tomitella sp.]
MSVTFSPEMAPIVGYRLDDLLGGRSGLYASYEQAERALVELNESGAVLPGCEHPNDARMYGAMVRVVTADDGDDPSINMSNNNAVGVLALLGIDTSNELAGELGADDFLGRVLVAQAVKPADPGVPATVVSDGGMVAVACGRRPGYEDERLTQLREIAEWCRAKNRTVCWS